MVLHRRFLAGMVLLKPARIVLPFLELIVHLLPDLSIYIDVLLLALACFIRTTGRLVALV